VSLRAVLFRGDGSDESVELDGEAAYRVARDELLWVDVEAAGADELAALRAALVLDDQPIAALEAQPTRPGASVVDGGVEVVLVALADAIDGDPIALHLLVGDAWVITSHARPVPFLDAHRASLRDDRRVGELSPVEFLVSPLDWHVDSFFRAAEQLEAAVDKLDDAALKSESHLLHRLVRMRRRIAGVRRILNPHREVLAEIARPDFLPDLDADQREALAAVTLRLERAGEAVANTREMLIGTFDVHMTRTAQRTNDIMRILTLVSVVLLPSVVLAGVMGMNFKVGLFEEANLFWVVVGAMIVMAIGTFGFARWRGWL
jgi:Mg2+ and Co2+ transporter CorA